MTHMENQLELFRGHIEELQGKMQQALSQLEGPRGAMGMVKGRGLEMRGKARQTMARARMGVEDFSDTVQRHPENYAPFGGLFIAGLAVAAVAIFWPETFNRIRDWLQMTMEQGRERMGQAREQVQQTGEQMSRARTGR